MLKNLIKHTAFTMAEILLSLTIIGVVAAITLPSLTGNINERTWNTQRKALHARLSQAIALMDNLRGYGTMSTSSGSHTDRWGYTTNTNNYSSDNAAEAFVTAGLAKVLKLNNICDYSHLYDCGLPDTFTTYGNEKFTTSNLANITGLNSKFQAFSDATPNATMSSLETKAAAFETVNGESILVHYNPICKGILHNSTETSRYIETKTSLCANFIYDLNGKKGPNTMGKDMGFISIFYPSDPVIVAPSPHKQNISGGNLTFQAATQACKNLDDSRLPNVEELMSLSVNQAIMDENFSQSSGGFWSSGRNPNAPDSAYYLWVSVDGIGIAAVQWNKYNVRCVYRN